MVAYNFQSRFADDVERGVKRQTIRAHGKRRHVRPGESLQLYTGMRTKSCRKLMDATCLKVLNVTIDKYGPKIEGWGRPHRQHFARRDGFEDWSEMFEFFKKTNGVPFEGVLITW